MGGPMGAYEDALPWMKPEKATIAEAVDAGGATRLAHSPAYEQQAFVFKRAYALQFHLEISSSLATEWGDVPAYAEALEGSWARAPCQI
jgi:GMP synthase-like glutamine amidotransferase